MAFSVASSAGPRLACVSLDTHELPYPNNFSLSTLCTLCAFEVSRKNPLIMSNSRSYLPLGVYEPNGHGVAVVVVMVF
jgi:hypothetical protein